MCYLPFTENKSEMLEFWCVMGYTRNYYDGGNDDKIIDDIILFYHFQIDNLLKLK